MIGMGFSEKPVAYEYIVNDHADIREALQAHLNIHNAHILGTTSVIYAEVIPEPGVVMLADDIGHWPQPEAPDAALA
ncbi:hypothetical protein A5702_14920 [Mycobacterium sp. E3339]|nr:hypothetical protein A5702_14920 [Mycobacterium sp. E3339]